MNLADPLGFWFDVYGGQTGVLLMVQPPYTGTDSVKVYVIFASMLGWYYVRLLPLGQEGIFVGQSWKIEISYPLLTTP